jgi:hypothetical protein
LAAFGKRPRAAIAIAGVKIFNTEFLVTMFIIIKIQTRFLYKGYFSDEFSIQAFCSLPNGESLAMDFSNYKKKSKKN